jgi:hypothetical protein
MILRGRRVASIKLTDIFFHALLFAISIYIVRYLTRTFHILEGFEDASAQNAGDQSIGGQGENSNVFTPPGESSMLDSSNKPSKKPMTVAELEEELESNLTERKIQRIASEEAEELFKDPNTLVMLQALNLKKKDVAAMLKCTAPRALKRYVRPKVVNKIIADTLKPYNF